MDLDRPNLKNITKHVRRDENVTCFRVGRTDSLVQQFLFQVARLNWTWNKWAWRGKMGKETPQARLCLEKGSQKTVSALEAACWAGRTH